MHRMSIDHPERPVIRVRAHHLRQAMGGLGLRTDQDTARYLHVSPSTLSRIMHGRAVGARFVASVLYLTHDVTFSDVFSVELDREQVDVAA